MKRAKINRKAQICEQAAILFKEQGYKATTMRDLAEKVGLQVSSLYSHFSSKEAMLQQICMDNAQQFMDGMQQIEKHPTSCLEQIKSLIALHINMAIQSPTSVIVFSEEWKHLSEPTLSRFLALRKSYEKRFKQILNKGIENGQVQAYDTKLIFFTILNATRWLNYTKKKYSKQTIKQLHEEIAAILLYGAACKSDKERLT